MAKLSPALLDVLEHADFPADGDGLRQLAVAREAPEAVVDRLAALPSDESFEDVDAVAIALQERDGGPPSDHATTVLRGIAELEADGEPATVQALARTCGLTTSDIEAAVDELTTRDLVREVGVEDQAGATGAGRAWSIRAEPNPGG